MCRIMTELMKVRYTHDAVIDEILRDPSISQNDLCKIFGYSIGWMSICINSDAFQERMAERKALLTDPQLIATINQRLDAVAKRALDKIIDRLDSPTAQIKNNDLIAMAKLGVGDKNNRPAGPQIQQNLYVVALPAPAPDTKAWLGNLSNANSTPRVVQPFIENEPGVNRE